MLLTTQQKDILLTVLETTKTVTTWEKEQLVFYYNKVLNDELSLEDSDTIYENYVKEMMNYGVLEPEDYETLVSIFI